MVKQIPNFETEDEERVFWRRMTDGLSGLEPGQTHDHTEVEAFHEDNLQLGSRPSYKNR